MAAPPGNNFAGKGRIAAKALEDVMREKSGLDFPSQGVETYEAMRNLWRVQYEKALGGDNQSMNMIVERLDGKPKQAIVGGDDDDPPLTHRIVREIVRAKNTDR